MAISDGGLFVLAGMLLLPWCVNIIAYAMVPAMHRKPFGWWCKLEVIYTFYYPILILIGVAMYTLFLCIEKPRAASRTLFLFLSAAIVIYIFLTIACGLFGA